MLPPGFLPEARPLDLPHLRSEVLRTPLWEQGAERTDRDLHIVSD